MYSVHNLVSSFRSADQQTDSTDPAALLASFHQPSLPLTGADQTLVERVTQLRGELAIESAERLHELAEKERLADRLGALLRVLPGGVVVLDERGWVTECNPAASEMLGEPLHGERWSDVIERCFAPQAGDGHEISLKDGRLMALATRSLDGGHGQLILLTDQTETRELQRRLGRDERLISLGKMMAALAHQLRTPLAAAMLYSGQLRDNSLPLERRERTLERLSERLQHMEEQIREMTVFVKGEVTLTDQITLAQLLEKIESSAETAVTAAGASIEFHLNAPPALLRCNQAVLLGAVTNLINNALQAAPQQSRLRVELLQIDAERIAIRVEDQGPGLRGREQAALGEFYTTKASGTGLGLPVVLAVARAHHGDFILSDLTTNTESDRRGARAELRLPVMRWLS